MNKFIYNAGHKTEYPTIVIPGVIGSELSEGDNKRWVSLSDSTVKRMGLTSTGESVNDDVVNNDDDFGAQDTYKNLVTSLRKEYGTDDVYFFAYDWRLDNANIADKLSAYIRNVIGTPKVNIVVHSMGGLVALSYIKKNSHNVNKFISLSTPYLRSPKVPYVFSTGNLIIFEGVYPVANGGLKSIASHMTSAYQLLPYKNAEKYIAVQEANGEKDCDNEFDFIKNTLKMTGTDDIIISPTVKGAFLDKSTTFMESIHTASGGGSGAGSISSSAIELVDSYAIAGTGKDTIKKIIYSPDGDYVKDLTFTFGDGTVPEWSANINGLIPTKQYNLEHTELASDPKVIAKVKEMLNGAKPEYNDAAAEETNENVVLRVAAEANISISDGEEILTNINDH